MELARDRKQRQDAQSVDSSAIPLAYPDTITGEKNGKTLIEMIAERNGGILPDEKSEASSDMGSGPGTRFVTVDPATGEISGFDPDEEEGEGGEGRKKDTEGEEEEMQDQPLPAFLDTVLLSFPLATLHLTLAYMAAYQYAAEIPISHLVRESALVAFPILTLLIHLAHGHIISFGRADEDAAAENTANNAVLFPLTSEKLSLSFFRQLVFPPTAKTLVFLPLSILLGIQLMAVTNQAPYYAVMKRAPAIGTLWVWSILEVPFGASVVGALGPLCWGVWWEGYGLF